MMTARRNDNPRPTVSTQVRPDPASPKAWLPRQWRSAAWTLAWALCTLFVLGLAAIGWLDHLLRQAGRDELTNLTAEYLYSLVGLVSAALVGAVVASRRPRHPVGWLLLTFVLVTVSSVAAEGYVGYALLARPGALPAADAAVAAAYALGFSGTPALILALVLLFTPTGSLPSPRWRWLATALVAMTALNLLTPLVETQPLDPPLESVTSPLATDAPTGPIVDAVGLVLTAAFVLSILAAAGSLVVRFRRARGTERQQLKWVAFAAALAPVAALVTIGGNLIGDPAVAAVTSLAPGAVTWAIPLALGAAVLRYRLYDLDRIVSRTIAYGLLTLLLGGGYAVVVLGLGQLVRQDSPLVVAAATLTVAAAFQPARRRIQHLVDRRFDRRRYDAAQTIAAFSARLRQQLDVDRLTAELLAVVDQTMQPATRSLWLRPFTTSPHIHEPGRPPPQGAVGVADDTPAPFTGGSTKDAQTQPAPEGGAV